MGVGSDMLIAEGFLKVSVIYLQNLLGNPQSFK